MKGTEQSGMLLRKQGVCCCELSGIEWASTSRACGCLHDREGEQHHQPPHKDQVHSEVSDGCRGRSSHDRRSSRGYLLELLINKLLFLQAAEGLDLQLICLSATLPNIRDIVRYTNSACFVATQRPNRLSEYLIVAAHYSVKSSATTKSSARPITFSAATKRSVGLISWWNPCAPLYRCASLLWTCAIAKPTRTSW